MAMIERLHATSRHVRPLAQEGASGSVAATAAPDDAPDAIVAAPRAGGESRRFTASWFRANAERLSLDDPLMTVVGAYEET